jgi:hypothetical protein
MEDLELQSNQHNLQDEEDVKDENTSRINKISFPKRKFAIIHGYNGHQFCGNQK